MKIFSKFFHHNLIRSSVIVFSGSMLSNVFAWLYHLLIGRILGPEKYAEFAALFALFYIFNVPTQVLQLSLVKFFSIYKARKSLGKSKRLFISITQKLIAFEFVGFIALLPFVPLLSSFLHIASYINFIFLYFLFASSVLPIINASALQAYHRFFDLTMYNNITAVLRLLFGIIFAVLGVGWVLLSNIVSNLIGYGIYFFPVRFIFQTKSEPLDISRKQFVSYSIPTLVTIFSVTLLFSQDILFVKHFFSSNDAGIYAALSVLGKVIFYASSAMGLVIFPMIAEKKELKQQYAHEILLGTILVGGLSLFITTLYFLVPQLVLIPFGHAFAKALPYLGIFGIFITFFSLSSMLINILLALGKTKVWFVALCGSLIQALGLMMIHRTLQAVIYVNISVSILMFLSLTGYFYYEQRKV